MPVLRSLAESIGSTAHLTVADGDEALALAVVEPTWTDFHVSYRVGARHALSQGAAGKAIALLDAAEPAYAVTSGELQTGARGLAAPVRGVDGLRASVGVVTLDGRDRRGRRRTAGDRGRAARWPSGCAEAQPGTA